MINKKHKLLTAGMCILLMSCNMKDNVQDKVKESKKYTLAEKANWLVGTWQNISADGIATETWDQLNDSALAGSSYFVAGNDTLSSENIRLEQRGDKLKYIPTVNNQNNGRAIEFALTLQKEDLMVFENPAHDFPQKISYRMITKDSIIAEISGMMKGKQNVQHFPFNKKH